MSWSNAGGLAEPRNSRPQACVDSLPDNRPLLPQYDTPPALLTRSVKSLIRCKLDPADTAAFVSLLLGP